MKNCTVIFNNKSMKINFNEDVPESLIKYSPDMEGVYRINGHVKKIRDGIQKLSVDFRITGKIDTIHFYKVSHYEVKNGMRLSCISKPAGADANAHYKFVSSTITNEPINRDSVYMLDDILPDEYYEHIIMANAENRFNIIQVVAKSSNTISRKAIYILE